MITRELFDERKLRGLLESARVPSYTAQQLIGRILTLEMVARAVRYRQTTY
jgi:hypothetical protein